MTFVHTLLAVGASFLFLCLVFRPLELVFPAKRGQKFLRPEFWTDVLFFLGQYLLWGGGVLWVLSRFGDSIDGFAPAAFRATVAGQPWWLQAIEVILLSDLFIYWGHRIQHRVPFLWRFHSIHHSAEHLDWLAAHREHPLDTVYTMGLINLPAFLLGFPLETLTALIAFRGIWAIYIHSNVRLPIGPLRWFIGAPELHHWHHDRARDAERSAGVSDAVEQLAEPLPEGVERQARALAVLGLGELVPDDAEDQVIADQLTGLAEYRNGGLFVDGGVLVPKHESVVTEAHGPGSEVIVEWRALTVALLDRLAERVRDQLGLDAQRFPLAKVLEGGTWHAGREIARELREDGTPPIRIESDGTVF